MDNDIYVLSKNKINEWIQGNIFAFGFTRINPISRKQRSMSGDGSPTRSELEDQLSLSPIFWVNIEFHSKTRTPIFAIFEKNAQKPTPFFADPAKSVQNNDLKPLKSAKVMKKFENLENLRKSL